MGSASGSHSKSAIDTESDCDGDSDTDPDNAVQTALSGSKNKAGFAGGYLLIGPTPSLNRHGLQLPDSLKSGNKGSMSIKPRPYHASPEGKTKHLYLPAPNVEARAMEYVPRFYFEARVDFADVRSGLRETVNINRALEIFPIDDETLWTRDMVWTVDTSSICADKPETARLSGLPVYVDSEFLSRLETHCLRYLLRYFEVKILHNHASGLFSFPGEAEAEFSKRCQDALSEYFRRDLDALRESFERKLERTREKYLNSDNWRDLEPTQIRSRLRTILHQMSETITEFFLNSENQNLPTTAVQEELGVEMQELGERLTSLEAEVRQAVGRLRVEYKERARLHDEYLVRPGLKDIYLERTCILWMPESYLSVSGGPESRASIADLKSSKG